MPPRIGTQGPETGKTRRRWLRSMALLFALCLLPVFAGCHHEPPEQALRNTIAGMQAAVQAHDTDALVDPVAPDFSGQDNMDARQFRRYVTLIMLQNRQVGVQLGPLDVKLFGDRATVGFTAATSGGGNWLPEHAQVYRVDTGWRLDGSHWKLISAKWQPQL